MLNNREIEKHLLHNKHTRKYFKGVYSIDQISKIKKISYGIIVVNTDPSNLPGHHWFAISIHSKKQPAELFDSFGRKLTDIHIQKFIEKHTNGKTVYNKKIIQHPFSSLCGYYCCMYVLYKSLGLSMTKFVDQFGENLQKNDKLIKKLYYFWFK